MAVDKGCLHETSKIDDDIGHGTHAVTADGGYSGVSVRCRDLRLEWSGGVAPPSLGKTLGPTEFKHSNQN